MFNTTLSLSTIPGLASAGSLVLSVFVSLSLYTPTLWDVVTRSAWAGAGLQAGTVTGTAVTCVTLGSALLWDTFLAVVLDGLAIVRLKQKYTLLLLVHIILLFCNLNGSILNLC